MKAITLYIGLDVHQDSITLAIAEPGSEGELRLFGTISHDLHALEKALSRIRIAHPGAGAGRSATSAVLSRHIPLGPCKGLEDG